LRARPTRPASQVHEHGVEILFVEDALRLFGRRGLLTTTSADAWRSSAASRRETGMVVDDEQLHAADLKAGGPRPQLGLRT
jgi:hypothetical protein